MSNPTSSAVVFSGYLPIEVTDSDFQKTVGNNETGNSEKKKHSPHKSMTKRFGGLLSSSRKKKDNDSDRNSVSGLSSTGQQSVASKTVDSGTATVKVSNLQPGQGETKLGLTSGALTSDKLMEVKASADPGESKKQNTTNNKHKPPKPWKSLKRLVVKGRHSKQQTLSLTPQSSSDMTDPGPRRHAKSHDGAGSFPPKFLPKTNSPLRKRFFSEGVDAVPVPLPPPQRLERVSYSEGFSSALESQLAMDRVIVGRLDGIDVLSLGPASWASLPIASTKSEDEAKTDGNSGDNDNGGDGMVSFDPLHKSFTELQSTVSPAKIIDEMIWTSSGMEQAEIILEGFYPGSNDRWGVRIATLQPRSQLDKPMVDSTEDDGENSTSLLASILNSDNKDGDESTATATDTTENDGSTNLPIAELWDSLWGIATPPPIPSHMNMQTTNASSSIDSEEGPVSPDDEDIQQCEAMCNVPIDLDDDAFMIDSPHHVKSVHDVVMIPLQARRFESAISLFEKLQRGLVDDDEKYSHLVASTTHNIGMIQLCQGKYREALISFQKAVKIRKECLPDDHPDIAVSLQREGMAHFALGSVVEALKCFESALSICTSMDNTRAKILNNVGVARYQLQDYAQALKSFTSALEIQRPWLEGPIQRESIVYSASTILSNMGKVYLREGDHDLAYFVFEEACLMQTSIFRKDHDIVLCSLDNMARAHAKNGNYAEALRIFTSLHRSQAARFGPTSDVCVETLGMVGISHLKLLEYEEANKCMKKVQAWQLHKGMDESHPSVRVTNDHLQLIQRCLQGEEPMWV